MATRQQRSKTNPEPEKIEKKKYPVYRIQTVRALPCHLCGYDFDLKMIMKKDSAGNKKKEGAVYTLDGKDFPEKTFVPKLDKDGKEMTDKNGAVIGSWEIVKDENGDPVSVIDEIVHKMTSSKMPMARIIGSQL